MPRKKTHKIQVIKVSPYRSARWRFDRISELIINQNKRDKRCLPIKGIDDEQTITGFAFIRRWENICKTTAPDRQGDRLAELFFDNPPLYFAYDIFLRADDDYCKSALEARILARQADEAIAKSLSIHDPATVQWYEQLFFNVRDRLDSVDYISKQIIGPLIGQGLHNVDMQLSAKFFGYFGGETVLEFMLHGVDRHISPPRSGSDIDAYADSVFGSMVRARSMVAAQAIQPDSMTVMPLLELHAKLIEEHNKNQLVTGRKSHLEDTVSALLCAVPWSIGQNREKMLADSPLGAFTGSAVEPRAADLLKISSGEPLDYLDDLKTKTLPPPRKKVEENKDEHTK